MPDQDGNGKDAEENAGKQKKSKLLTNVTRPIGKAIKRNRNGSGKSCEFTTFTKTTRRD